MYKIGGETKWQMENGLRAGGGKQKRSMDACMQWYIPYRESGLNSQQAFLEANKQVSPPFGWQVRIKWEKEYCEFMGIPYVPGKAGRPKRIVSSIQKRENLTQANEIVSSAFYSYINNIEETNTFSSKEEKINNKIMQKKTIPTPTESQVSSDPGPTAVIEETIKVSFMQVDGIMWKITELAKGNVLRQGRSIMPL